MYVLCMHVDMYVCLFVCMYVCVCLLRYECICVVCMYVSMYLHYVCCCLLLSMRSQVRVPQTGWLGRYLNVRHCGVLSEMLLQFRFLSRRDMTEAATFVENIFLIMKYQGMSRAIEMPVLDSNVLF